jgi:hypothetical protein
LGEKFEGTRGTVGRSSQTFAIHIFADTSKQLAVSSRDLTKIFFRQPIDLARKPLLGVEIRITALNHKSCKLT